MADDPVFGRFLKRKPWWSGEADWPHGTKRIGVMIFGASQKPTDKDRRAFAAVRDAYPTLLPRISQALFSLWESAPPSARGATSSPANPAELLAQLRLECICIEHSATVELLYEGAVGLFTVRIEDGNVQPGAFDGAFPDTRR
jgi:hypothetical protein